MNCNECLDDHEARLAALRARVTELEAALQGLKDDGLSRLAVVERCKPSNMRIGQVREIRWWVRRLQDTTTELAQGGQDAQ